MTLTLTTDSFEALPRRLQQLRAIFEEAITASEKVTVELQSGRLPASFESLSSQIRQLFVQFHQLAMEIGVPESESLLDLDDAVRRIPTSLVTRFMSTLEADLADGTEALQQIRLVVEQSCEEDGLLEDVWSLKELIDASGSMPLASLTLLFERVSARFGLSVALAAQSKKLRLVDENDPSMSPSFAGVQSASPLEPVGLDSEQSPNEMPSKPESDAHDKPSPGVAQSVVIGDTTRADPMAEPLAAVHSLIELALGQAPEPPTQAGSAVLMTRRTTQVIPPFVPVADHDSTTFSSKLKSSGFSGADEGDEDLTESQSFFAIESNGHVGEPPIAVLSKPSEGDSRSDTAIPCEAATGCEDTPQSAHVPPMYSTGPEITDEDIEEASSLGVAPDASSSAFELEAAVLAALSLVPDYPSAAFQLANAAQQLAPTETSPVPPWVFRLLALSPLATSGASFANEQLRADFQTAYIELTNGAYIAHSLAPILAACAIGPAIVAPDTAASTLLRALPLPGDLQDLAQVIATFGDQLGGVELFALAPQSSNDLWQTRREDLRRRAEQWWQDAEHKSVSGLRFVPARSVLRSWLKPEGFLARHIDALRGTADVPNDRAALLDITRLTNADINRRIDEADASTKGKGSWIDGKARRVLFDTAESAIALLRDWVVLANSVPSVNRANQGAAARTASTLGVRINDSLVTLSELVGLPDKIQAQAYRLLERALVNLRNGLAGGAPTPSMGPFPKAPQSVDETLGRDLLLVPLTLNAHWRPIEAPRAIAANLLTFCSSGNFDLQAIYDSHIARHDFLGANRLLHQVPSDLEWVGEALIRINQDVEEIRAKYIPRTNIAKRNVELALRDNLIQEADRERLQLDLSQLSTSFTIESFRSSVSRLEAIEKHIEERRAFESQRLMAALKSLAHVDEASKRRAETAIENGQFNVAAEYVRQLTVEGTLPAAAIEHSDSLATFYPGALDSLRNKLDYTVTVQDAMRRQVADLANSGELQFARSGRGAELSVMLNAWFSRPVGKPSLNEANVEKVLRWLGFEAVVVEEDRKISTEGRRIFHVRVSPISQRDVIPLPAFGSDRNGRYTIVVHANPAALHTEGMSQPSIHFLQAPLDKAKRADLAFSAKRKGLNFVVLDDLLLLFLANTDSNRLKVFFECSLPFTGLQPYTGTASIVPPETFYGREKEIAKVIDPNGTCLIYGGRQLGKTALLLQCVTRYNNIREGRGVFWMDLNNHLQSDATAMFGRIFSELKSMGVFPQGRKSYNDRSQEDILTWLAQDERRQITFLLDEADTFLANEQENGFRNVGTLKSLMERSKKRFKVVFAGLHNVVRFSKIPNHPLAHFGEPVNIGPLMGSEWREALALIERPLRALGYRLDEDAALSILLQANYYPVLLQLWGRHLLDYCYSLESTRIRSGPPYAVDRQVVDDTYSSRRELRQQLREKFRFTLQLDERYMVIAYALRYIADDMAQSAAHGVSFDDLLNTVVEVWPEGFGDMSRLDFRTYLEEMEGLGVLRPVDFERYSFQNPSVALLMGTADDIVSVLAQPRKLATRDPNQLRKLDNRDASPLTSLQMKELYGNTSGAVIIVGSRALGLDRVVSFLVREEATEVSLAGKCADRAQFVRFNQAQPALDDKTVFVVSDAETSWNASWVEYAIERGKKSGNGRRRRWVFVVDPRTAWEMDAKIEELEQRGASVLRLERWGEAALSAWVNVNSIALQHEQLEGLSALTGGQPWLLERFREVVRTSATAAQAFDEFQSACRTKTYAAEYQKALGLSDVPEAVAAVIVRLTEYGDACTLDEVVELVSDTFGADFQAGAVRREVGDALRWAQRLSLVAVVGEGRWQPRADVAIAIA